MMNLKKAAVSMISFAMLAVASTASAAVPAELTTAYTDLGTDFGTILGYGVTLAIAVTVGLISIKWIKKVAMRAS